MVGASATMRRSPSSLESRMRSGLRSSRARLSSDSADLVPAEVAHQRVAVGSAALLVAERVDFQHGLAGDAERLQDIPAAGDHLGVGQRLGRADQLDVDLVELAVAALLRPLVAEHRAGAEHLLRQRLGQPVGHQGAADAGGGFRPQRDRSRRRGPRSCTSPSSPRRRSPRACGRTRGCPRRSAWPTRRSRRWRRCGGRCRPHAGGGAGPRRSGRGCRGRLEFGSHAAS